jgi:hypothetical protein
MRSAFRIVPWLNSVGMKSQNLLTKILMKQGKKTFSSSFMTRKLPGAIAPGSSFPPV